MLIEGLRDQNPRMAFPIERWEALERRSRSLASVAIILANRRILRKVFASYVRVLMKASISSTTAGTTTEAKAKSAWVTRYVTESERGFLLAAVARLIPPDERWPGAAEADVVNYIDLQMAGPWGKGELLYRHGPFRKGTPSQGYQLEYIPAELFRRSIAAINSHFSAQVNHLINCPQRKRMRT
jgi:hypothetical protein